MASSSGPFERNPQGPDYRGAPRIDAPPLPDSALAYSEDAISKVMNDIYRHLIRIAYVPADEVVFPPGDGSTGRHDFDRAFYRGLNMSDYVISLLERLPYVDHVPIHPSVYQTTLRTEWYPGGYMIDYRDHNVARQARDAGDLFFWATGDMHKGNAPPLDFMRPDDVALTFPWDKGQYMILDTGANTIRFMHRFPDLPKAVSVEKREVPHQELHYRNFPAYHAPSVLQTYLQDLVTLSIIPGYFKECLRLTQCDNAASITARIMRDCFGWPADLRQQAWSDMVSKVRHEAAKADDHLQDIATEENWRDSLGGPLFSEEKMRQVTDEVIIRLRLSVLTFEES